MLARLALAFTLLPIIEIAVLVWIAGRTSLVFVLCLVIATGLAGALLVRQQSWQTLRRISTDLRAGVIPGESLLDGLLVLVAAFLLIMPGVLSDVAAIALLFPPTRKLFKSYLRHRFATRVVERHSSYGQFDEPERIIDVRVVEPRSDRNG